MRVCPGGVDSKLDRRAPCPPSVSTLAHNLCAMDPKQLAALGHKLRLHALVTIHDMGEASPNDLTIAQVGERPSGKEAEEWQLDYRRVLSKTSYHVREMVRRGLIEETRTVPRRGAVEHYYVLTGAGRELYEGLALGEFLQ